MRIRLLALALLFFHISSNIYASNLEISITKALNSNQDRPFNGIVLVTQSADTLYEKAQGAHDAPKVTSQFVIGSISKQITATMILELADKGLIDLEKSIYEYLPDLECSWKKDVKVKHLLNHTSGIITLDQSLAFEPGSQFRYSPTFTFYLLAQIAEKASGLRYVELMTELFKKADMTDSLSAETCVTKVLYNEYPSLIQGYKESGSEIISVEKLDEGIDLKNEKWTHPGGGLISTAHDLLKWNQALHEKKILLSPKIYKQMITPSSRREHPRYGTIEYGFGVQLLEKENIFEISHSGYVDGYTSTLLYYPDTKISVIILENISWDVKNVKRTFWPHDRIRDIIRNYIHSQQKK